MSTQRVEAFSNRPERLLEVVVELMVDGVDSRCAMVHKRGALSRVGPSSGNLGQEFGFPDELLV